MSAIAFIQGPRRIGVKDAETGIVFASINWEDAYSYTDAELQETAKHMEAMVKRIPTAAQPDGGTHGA